jgi:hypothetical protein
MNQNHNVSLINGGFSLIKDRLKKGLKQGREEGFAQGKYAVVIEMIRAGLAKDIIMSVAKLSEKE